MKKLIWVVLVLTLTLTIVYIFSKQGLILNSTSEQKTYSNDEYGFALQYPTTFKANTIGAGKDETVSVVEISRHISTAVWGSVEVQVGPMSDTCIDGKKFGAATYDLKGALWGYYKQHGNKCYFIQETVGTLASPTNAHPTVSQSEFDSLKPQIDAIAESFTFTK